MLKTDLKTRGLTTDLRKLVEKDDKLIGVANLDDHVQQVKKTHSENKARNEYLDKEF